MVRVPAWSNVDVVFRLLAAGRLDTDSLLTHVVSPNRAGTVFERLEARSEEILGVNLRLGVVLWLRREQ